MELDDSFSSKNVHFMWNVGWSGVTDNYSGFSLLSPQSQSSTYSMDSGYSGLAEASNTSPSQSIMTHQALASSTLQAFTDFNDHESFQGCGSEFYVQHQSPIAYPPFMSPSTATVPTNTFTAECATLNVNPGEHLKPHLEIIEQPTDKPFRFRYKSEMHGTHGSLMGVYTERSKRTYPTVALRNFNFASKAMIRCSLYQVPNDAGSGNRSPHSHQLVIRRGDIEESDPHDFEVSSQNDFTAIFQGMGIIHTAKRHIKDELYNKICAELEFSENRKPTAAELATIQRNAEKQSKEMNLNQVCLCFQAYIRNEIDNMWIKICDPVYSNVVNNLKSALFGELRITRMSTYTSQASGGQEVFMFVEKVCKNNIKVRFYEQNDDGSDGWEAFGVFTEADVHHQYGIVLKTPPYKKLTIDSRVTVKVQLFRPRDGSKSEPLDFEYKPNVHLGSKRRRSDSSDFIPTVIGSHESSSHENTSSSFSGGRQYQELSQNFGAKSTQSGNQSYELEESLFALDSLPSYFGTFSTAELDLSPTDLKGFWQCSPEEFCRLLDIGGESKLEIDGAGGRSLPIPAESDMKCSLLEKLKLMIKMFRNNFEDVKLQEMLKSLIDSEAETGENILHATIERGAVGDIKEIVLILVKYKLKDVLQSLNELDQNCFHLLVLAGYPNLLRIFLNLGVDVNQADAFGQTPLHLAVLRNDKHSVEELLDGSTTLKLNELNDDGFSPLHLAVMQKNLAIVKILIESGADLRKKNPPTGDNVLHMAVEVNQISMPLVKLLIDSDEALLHQENNARRNALQVASTNGQPSSELMDFLQGLYEESYTSAKIRYEDEISSSDSDSDAANSTFNCIFDDRCLNELRKIFDVDEKWKGISMLAGLEEKIVEWEENESPTLSLFQFFQRTNKSIDSIQEILHMLDEKRALETIDAMLARKLDL